MKFFAECDACKHRQEIEVLHPEEDRMSWAGLRYYPVPDGWCHVATQTVCKSCANAVRHMLEARGAREEGAS